jgi:hypothetical protein
MNTRFKLLSLIFLLISHASVYAGTLNKLEENATTKSSETSRDSNSDNDSSSSGFMATIVSGLVEVAGEVIIAGGAFSFERHENTLTSQFEYEQVVTNNAIGDSNYSAIRTSGDPVLPLLKFSAHALLATDDIVGVSNYIEVGYGAIAISYSNNLLFEAGDDLQIENTLFHYRMSLGNAVAIGFAAGSGEMNGEDKNTSSIFSMPIRFEINENYNFEYYPVWSNFNAGEMAEHQFSLNRHYEYFGLTLGYKKTVASSVAIHGMFAGLYASY